MMEFREVKNKEVYNKFVVGQKHSQFLQSWEWGKFQSKAGFPVLRLGLYVDEDLKFATTLIKKKLIVGKYYFYCPRVGIKNLSEKELRDFLGYVKDLAEKQNVVFLRFEPRTAFDNRHSTIDIRQSLDVQPSQTMILDLEKSEEELLVAMHQKTRYNIRLAGRKGVRIRKVASNEFDKFWTLMKETAERDGIRLHPREYYRGMLDLSSDDFELSLYFAEHDGEILSANIITRFGDMATYLHGSSSNKKRNLMAPYLLQWEVICEMRKKGCKYYDFCGIGAGALAGVARFKSGFRGEEIKYPGVFDIVFNEGFYRFYKVLRKVRRMVNKYY